MFLPKILLTWDYSAFKIILITDFEAKILLITDFGPEIVSPTEAFGVPHWDPPVCTYEIYICFNNKIFNDCSCIWNSWIIILILCEILAKQI